MKNAVEVAAERFARGEISKKEFEEIRDTITGSRQESEGLGQQPLGFTSDWCLRHTLPSDWDEQRRLLATL